METEQERKEREEEDKDVMLMREEWLWRRSLPTAARIRREFGIATSSSSAGGTRKIDKEEVRERVDVAALLDSYGIRHRRVGGSLSFLCQVHRDTRPSASFSVDRKSWKCFSCGEGGDVFSFVMAMEGMAFPQAVEKLWRDFH